MVRRITGMLAVVIGLAIWLYFSWAATRFGHAALSDPRGPRPWPYPDGWMWALNDWYDARYPAVRGIKLHGERERVLRDVTWAARAGATLCIGGLALLVAPLIRRWRIVRRRGFDVLQ